MNNGSISRAIPPGRWTADSKVKEAWKTNALSRHSREMHAALDNINYS